MLCIGSRLGDGCIAFLSPVVLVATYLSYVNVNVNVLCFDYEGYKSLEVEGAYLPTKQCRTTTNASPHTLTSGLVRWWSAKRSSVVTTEPLVLFSKGTTLRSQLSDCTAANTEGMVGEGISSWPSEGGKHWRAALKMFSVEVYVE